MLWEIQDNCQIEEKTMHLEVEINSLDLRYESCRMKNKASERVLCASILEHGIREPLQGVGAKEKRILLNGFKRYRCARKLGIHIVPYISLGNDEAFGIIQLIRIANSRSLSILEQARLLEELRNTHKMSISDIAALLEKSKSWVSMRSGVITEISKNIADHIFKGEFPLYSYMYTLRRFIRMNFIKKDEIDEFVDLVSGKNLSIRDIERLAHGYFRGPEGFREQLKTGNISWGLTRVRELDSNRSDCSKSEKIILNDLEITRKYMQRITCKSGEWQLKSNAFYAQAHLLAGGIIRILNYFSKGVKDLYDRSGKM